MSQFSHSMTAQADLRVEAAHVRRFYDNFLPLADAVVVPRLISGYQSEAVLVETYEPGESVARYIRAPAPWNTAIVSLGVDTYLKVRAAADPPARALVSSLLLSFSRLQHCLGVAFWLKA